MENQEILKNIKPISPFFKKIGLDVPTLKTPQHNSIRVNGKGVKKHRFELSRGCPNNCLFCPAPRVKSLEEVEVFNIPEIKSNFVEIVDMNFLFQPDILERIKELGERRFENKLIYYHCISGLDYRLLNKDIVDELRKSHFINIRIAWDNSFNDQVEIKKCIGWFIHAGYIAKRHLGIFIIINHKISYEDCLRKLELLKIWRVKVCDECFNGGYDIAVPLTWTAEQIKEFRKACCKHNQLVNFGIDVKHLNKLRRNNKNAR